MPVTILPTTNMTQTKTIFTIGSWLPALMTGCGHGQFARCPGDATSCCQCVRTPGCAWMPPQVNSSRPRCTSLMMAPDHPNPDGSTPGRLINDMEIPTRTNRPLNPVRRRFLRPQSGQLTMSLGLRKEVPVQVMSKARRVRLTVTGPIDAPQFSIEKGNELSCSGRFRLRERTYTPRDRNSGGRRGRRERSTARSPVLKKINIDCHGSGPREVHILRLIVDMNKCYTGSHQIRIQVRERGARKFRLEVSSACQCFCPPPGELQAPEVLGQPQEPETEDACQEGEIYQQCVSHEEEENHCSGVNDYCRRNHYEPVCSGRGTCICGVCMCDNIPVGGVGDVPDEIPIILDETVMPMLQRYSGAYCQCDDVSCPRSNGVVCGGPSRGMCRCGACLCMEGFEGEACEIAISNSTCIAPSGALCSNMGLCVNGGCVCNGDYVGQFCEVCPTCRGMCSRVAPCIECLTQAAIENARVTCQAVCSMPAGPPISFMLSDGMWPETADFCAIEQNRCRYEFAYTIEDDGEIVLHYQHERHCQDNE